MFRPDMNMKRMNTSAKRVALPVRRSLFHWHSLLTPEITGIQWRSCHRTPETTHPYRQKMDTGYPWLQSLHPSHTQSVFTFHPTHSRSNPPVVGTQAALGVQPPDEALFFVICSPVGPYYPTGFKPVALYGTTEYTRAAPGGPYIIPLKSPATRLIVRSFRYRFVQVGSKLCTRRGCPEGGCCQGVRPEPVVAWSGTSYHGGTSFELSSRKLVYSPVVQVGTMNAMIVFQQPNGGECIA